MKESGFAFRGRVIACAMLAMMLPQEGVAASEFSYPAAYCDRNSFTEVVASYGFDGALGKHFLDHMTWPSEQASFQQRHNRFELEVPRLC